MSGDFSTIKKAITDKINQMTKKGRLYVTSTDKDKLWDLYLDSFPKGTNEIYKERREYDCTCCNQFIRNIGSVVSINDDNTIESIWDIEVP